MITAVQNSQREQRENLLLFQTDEAQREGGRERASFAKRDGTRGKE